MEQRRGVLIDRKCALQLTELVIEGARMLGTQRLCLSGTRYDQWAKDNGMEQPADDGERRYILVTMPRYMSHVLGKLRLQVQATLLLLDIAHFLNFTLQYERLVRMPVWRAAGFD
jgi:hypothetical protein